MTFFPAAINCYQVFNFQWIKLRVFASLPEKLSAACFKDFWLSVKLLVDFINDKPYLFQLGLTGLSLRSFYMRDL